MLFITHYLNEIFGKIHAVLYVYSYNYTYKRNIVAKIIYIVLHFVLCKVVSLCKQTQNDTFNTLPEVPISAIREHLTARREQYTKPE